MTHGLRSVGLFDSYELTLRGLLYVIGYNHHKSGLGGCPLLM